MIKSEAFSLGMKPIPSTRWLLPFAMFIAVSTGYGQVASSWNVQISPLTNGNSRVSWEFNGSIASSGGVQWTNNVSSFGAFLVVSPETDLTGFYTGPDFFTPVSGVGGLSNVTGGFQYDFHSLGIRTNRFVLNIFPTMNINGQPFLKTSIATASVDTTVPFSRFGQGTYISPVNTFYSGLSGGFQSVVTVVPEPSTYSLIAAVAVAAILWTRRRRP